MKVYKNKDILNILIVLNSSDNLMGKYPIGNKELTNEVKYLEENNKIKYDIINRRWTK